jgi:talin
MAQSTSDQQRKLLQAAKLLAEATSKMVEAAKGCATNPQDVDMQSRLRKAAEDLRSATSIAAGDNLQLKLIKKLELSAKQTASCATQSIAAVQVCTLYHDQVVNNQTHTQLIEQCKIVADNVPRIVQGKETLPRLLVLQIGSFLYRNSKLYGFSRSKKCAFGVD